MLALPVLQRPPITEFASINPPKVPGHILLDGTIIAAGGTANSFTITSGVTNKIRKIIGGFVRLDIGASRNFEIDIVNGGTFFALSENNSLAKSLTGSLNIAVSDNLVIIADASSDTATFRGVISYEDIGFGAMAT